jgi:hypothetical protein
MDMSRITTALPPVEADREERLPAGGGILIAVAISAVLWCLICMAIFVI